MIGSWGVFFRGGEGLGGYVKLVRVWVWVHVRQPTPHDLSQPCMHPRPSPLRLGALVEGLQCASEESQGRAQEEIAKYVHLRV